MYKGQNIRDIISKKGLKNNDVYSKAHITEQTFYGVLKEGANPRVSSIEAIADALSCSIDAFFDRDISKVEVCIGHHIKGNGNRVSGDITLSECQKELEHLKDILKEKEERIKDKDEMISFLKQQLNK